MRKIGFIFEPHHVKKIIETAEGIAEISCIKLFGEKRKRLLHISFDTKRQPNKCFIEFNDIDMKGPAQFNMHLEKENTSKFIDDMNSSYNEIEPLNMLCHLSIKRHPSEFHFKYDSDIYVKKNACFVDIVYNNSSRERFNVKRR